MDQVNSTDEPPRFIRRVAERFWCLRVLFTDDRVVLQREVKHLASDRETELGRTPVGERAIIDDDAVSSLHARLRCMPSGQWQIKDEDSKNGTFVDGTRLGKDWTNIAENSLIAMGGTLLLLCHDGSVPDGEPIDDMEGDAYAVRRMFAQVRRAAKTNETVLLLGPSGSGKERCARAIHRGGERRNGPFVAVSCADFPASLIESELFGHDKGSFTGADRTRKGIFQQAHGGTLFLDEIGEMPLPLQSKLLRVLETRSVRPVGSDDRPVSVDVRLIAATNRNLEAEVEQGGFRLDLFHRLKQAVVNLPSLAERRSDIPLLAAALLDDAFDRLGFFLVYALLLKEWQGNVRELTTFIETKVRSDDAIVREEVQDFIAEHVPQDAERAAEEAATLERLTTSLHVHSGNLTRVARDLGCSARTIGRKLTDFGLDLATFRSSRRGSS
jgi:DNA-binding NtrC family response regulator